MAKQDYFFGKHAIPPNVSQSERIKTEFGALEENQTLNTGMITREKNLSTDAYPYLTPAPRWAKWGGTQEMLVPDFSRAPITESSGATIQTGYCNATQDDVPYYHDALGMWGGRDVLVVMTKAYDADYPWTGGNDQLTGYFIDLLTPGFGLRVHYRGYYGYSRATAAENLNNILEDIKIPNALSMGFTSNAFAVVDSEHTDIVIGGFPTETRKNSVTSQSSGRIQLCRNLAVVKNRRVVLNIGDEQESITGEVYITGNTPDEFRVNGSTLQGHMYDGVEYNSPYDIFCGNIGKYRTTGTHHETTGSSGIVALNRCDGRKDIYYMVAHMGRVFAGGRSFVAATDYNSLGRTLDTDTDYHESHGWESLLSAKGDTGDVTGICSYGGHVVVFKKGYMHEIHNTKNPFRVVDIGAVGCVDYRSICEVDGILFFAAEDGIFIYNGNSLPKLISSPLRIKKWDVAVAGSYDHKYYVYGESGEEKVLYVYDTQSGGWCEEDAPSTGIMNFAKTDFGFFYMTGGGEIYRMDDDYTDRGWFFETELFTNARLDNKRVRKVELYGDFSQNTNVKVYLLKHDETFDSTSSRKVYDKTFGEAKRASIRIPVRNTGGEGYKLHVEGTGYAKLYHMEAVVEEGGNRYATT